MSEHNIPVSRDLWRDLFDGSADAGTLLDLLRAAGVNGSTGSATFDVVDEVSS